MDEMVDGKGGLRPHWRSLLGAFTALGEGGLKERAQRLDRAFEEEGVTSILPGTAAGELAWRCDPVPLPIPAGEFAALEAGLAQRARLIEAMLEDLYGRQSLLETGAVPPALVFGNAGFLRPLHLSHGPMPPAMGPRLGFYAADLVRGPDGCWRVLSDRTSDASGVGYARENRRLLARVLPEVFRPVTVRQLRPFFDIWQDQLQRLAPGGRTGPTVALLTPGTRHDQWFEHMFLSRELSCALVEGGDLTVRGGVVFIKTLRGLQRVDVLLRRVSGRLVDPLELDASQVGVPGLLDAQRAGTIHITNDPGTGLAEAPGFAAFLPALCERLLGERLALASVPTMWLGDEASRMTLMQDPQHWLVRPATDGNVHAVRLGQLQPVERAIMLRRIEQRPWDWAATASVDPSMAPCFDGERLSPRPVVMRVFLAHDGQDWRAMQGGLARVMEAHDELAGRLPRGGLSKDVWVLNEERGDIVGPPVVMAPPLKIRRASGDLPSRVADDLFWLGRYVERLERSARLVRAAVARLARGAALLPREISELQSLARCLAEAGCVSREAAAPAASSSLAEALLGTVRDGGAIHRHFAAASRLTESVRDRLTGDMYATFTQTLRAARADAGVVGRSLDGLSHAMVSILRYSTSVAGVAAESMVRGGGWLFLDLGRRIERAQAVAGEVAIAVDQQPSRIETGLRLVLELCDSAITYRSRYLDVLQPAPVLDLVLADQGNPRGLAFQLVSIHSLLDELGSPEEGREMLAGAAAGLLAEVEALVERVLGEPDQSVAAAALPPALAAIGTAVAGLSDRITRRYFALLPVAQTIGVADDDEGEEPHQAPDREADHVAEVVS